MLALALAVTPVTPLPYMYPRRHVGETRETLLGNARPCVTKGAAVTTIGAPLAQRR